MTPATTVFSVDLDETTFVATVHLDRPDARNAMGPAFWSELPVIMDHLGGDERCRAVVLAARGPHFSVGLDLKAMGDLLSGSGSGGSSGEASQGPSMATKAARSRRTILTMQAAVSSVADCPKPVIAAIHGYCIGGGVDLISAADIRIASDDARFSIRETKMAIVADLGSLQRLPAIIGRGHLAELAFTGKDIDAGRAKEIGLVNEVYPGPGAVFEAAQAIALEIASCSPLAVQGTKAVLARAVAAETAEGLEYVATWNAGMLESHDLGEAVMSFLEKRPPRFTGR